MEDSFGDGVRQAANEDLILRGAPLGRVLVHLNDLDVNLVIRLGHAGRVLHDAGAGLFSRHAFVEAAGLALRVLGNDLSKMLVASVALDERSRLEERFRILNGLDELHVRFGSAKLLRIVRKRIAIFGRH